jgi:CO/xanthine dehydrogenase FAD-binding subunit
MNYYRPNSIEEYFVIDDKHTLLAGGTDLIPSYERGQTLPELLVDLKSIPELHGINEYEHHIEIGSSATIEEIQKNEIIANQFKALKQSTLDFGSVQIRNRATIGGNICNASPAGDTLPPLYALDTKVSLRTKNDERVLNIEEFILGPGKTDLKDGEILQKIIIHKNNSDSLFYKLGLRAAMAISVINFAIVYNPSQLTIAVGAVAPTILKFSSLEGMSTDNIINKIDRKISPIDDIRGTANYRRKVIKNMLSYELSKIIS